MIRLIQRKLIIPRGDTGSFSVPALNSTNEGAIAVFTIFDCLTHTKLFQKIVDSTSETLTIAFTHNDTVNLKPGKYVWDIKFYVNPQFVDEELVNGDEVDSYYAGYLLPECEIRETADNYLTSNEAPTAKLSPQQLDIISEAITVSTDAAVRAEESASNLDELKEQVAFLQKLMNTLIPPIKINSFSLEDQEIGSSITSIGISYTLNTYTRSLSVNISSSDGTYSNNIPFSKREEPEPGTVQSGETWSFIYPNSITTDSNFVLSVKDSYGYKDSKTATLKFLNKAYWGVAAEPSTISNSFLWELPTKRLTDTKARTISLTANTDQYAWYAVPSSFGECTFTSTNANCVMEKVTTFDHKNASGYTTSYDVYRSTTSDFGATKLTIT